LRSCRHTLLRIGILTCNPQPVLLVLVGSNTHACHPCRIYAANARGVAGLMILAANAQPDTRWHHAGGHFTVTTTSAAKSKSKRRDDLVRSLEFASKLSRLIRKYPLISFLLDQI
jgi:hypothetical protein